MGRDLKDCRKPHEDVDCARNSRAHAAEVLSEFNPEKTLCEPVEAADDKESERDYVESFHNSDPLCANTHHRPLVRSDIWPIIQLHRLSRNADYPLRPYS